MDTQPGLSSVRMLFQSLDVCNQRRHLGPRGLAVRRAVHCRRFASANRASAGPGQCWTRFIARLSKNSINFGCCIGFRRNNAVTCACRVNADESLLAEFQFHLLTIASDENRIVANLFARNHYIVILHFYLRSFTCHHACIVNQNHAALLCPRNRL